MILKNLKFDLFFMIILIKFFKKENSYFGEYIKIIILYIISQTINLIYYILKYSETKENTEVSLIIGLYTILGSILIISIGYIIGCFICEIVNKKN